MRPPSNFGLEPSRPLFRAIMSPRRAAQAARYTDGAQLVFLFGYSGRLDGSRSPRAAS